MSTINTTTEQSAPQLFPVWKTLEVGGREADEWRAELEAIGVTMQSDCQKFFDYYAHERQNLDFGRVSIRQLGFTKKVSITPVLQRVVGLGHALCPWDTVPAARLAYSNQSAHDSPVYIARKPEQLVLRRFGDPFYQYNFIAGLTNDRRGVGITDVAVGGEPYLFEHFCARPEDPCFGLNDEFVIVLGHKQ